MNSIGFRLRKIFSALEMTAAQVLNTGMTRVFSLFLLGLALTGPAFAQSEQLPAYNALRTVGKEKGTPLLSTLVEMQGSDANPQPVRWTLSFSDAAARGGIREFVVTTGGITAERTPAAAQALAGAGAMAAAGLNLDSTGAFTAANKEADKIKLGFSSLNYRLHNSKGVPVWTVQLYDVNGTEVGMIEISARDGSIVTPMRKAVVNETPAPVSPLMAGPLASPTPAITESDRNLGERWVEGGGLVGHVSRWGEKSWQTTTNTAIRVGDSISAFFVGRPPETPAPGSR